MIAGGASSAPRRWSSAARDARAQQVLILVHGLDHRGEEHDELQVLLGRVTGIQQVLVGGAQRPVVVLAAPVDALEGFLVQQAHQVVAARDELHLLHDEEIVVHGLVELGVHRGELVLARRDLVVLRLGRNAQRPQLVIEVLHVGRDGGADRAEVVLLEFLALGGRGAEEGASVMTRVAPLAVRLLLDEEVLLLVPTLGTTFLGCLPNRVSTRFAWMSRAVMERSSGVFLSSASPV